MNHNPAYVAPVSKTKTYKCPDCGRNFCNKENFNRHMTSHDVNSMDVEKGGILEMETRKKINIITVIEGKDEIKDLRIKKMGDLKIMKEKDLKIKKEKRLKILKEMNLTIRKEQNLKLRE